MILVPVLDAIADCSSEALWAAVRFSGRNAEVAKVACNDSEATDRSHQQRALPGLTVKVCN